MTTHRPAAPIAYPRRRVDPRSVTRLGRHSLILVVGVLTLAALAGVLYLSQASVAAELRFRLAETERQTHDVWGRNFALQQEIADLTRLDAVEERATRLGMVDAPASGSYVACTVPQETLVLSRPGAAVQARDDSAPAESVWERAAEWLGLAGRYAGPVMVRLERP